MAGAVSAQSFFRVPPTQVSIHSGQLIERQRSRTTISVRVPDDANNRLEKIILSQLVNVDEWVWDKMKPLVYYGDYSSNTRGQEGLATVKYSEERDDLVIILTPAVKPGEQVNIIFRGFNPAAGTYQWSSELVPEGPKPISSEGPMLRLNIYQFAPTR